MTCSFKLAAGLGGGDHHALKRSLGVQRALGGAAAPSWWWPHRCQPPVPTCEGWGQALEAVRLLQLLAHLPAVGLVLAQDRTALLQPSQRLEDLELVLEHGG